MTTATHTPGPWHQDRGDILTADGQCIAEAFSGPCANSKEVAVNARLMAAAPDLLSALLALRAASDGSFAGWHDKYRPALVLVERAIAAATGAES